jgi:hypothetical protein
MHIRNKLTVSHLFCINYIYQLHLQEQPPLKKRKSLSIRLIIRNDTLAKSIGLLFSSTDHWHNLLAREGNQSYQYFLLLLTGNRKMVKSITIVQMNILVKYLFLFDSFL